LNQLIILFDQAVYKLSSRLTVLVFIMATRYSMHADTIQRVRDR